VLDRRRDVLADLEARKAAVDQAASRIPELEAAAASRTPPPEGPRGGQPGPGEAAGPADHAQLEAERRQADEKLALLNDARERLTAEFKLLSDRILEEQGRRPSAERSTQQMDGLIGPLRQQLGDFKQRVEDVYDRESRDRAALRSEIGHLKHLNERIGPETP
jgi:DNA recombination protein RmuC